MNNHPHLLINCDLDWVSDRAALLIDLSHHFAEVTIIGQSEPIDNRDLSTVTHWITNPAPRYQISRELTSRLMPNLQTIGSPSTGLTHMECELADDGISVYCLQDIPKSELQKITASSEFTLLLFLSVVRKAKVFHNTDLLRWRDDLQAFRGRQVSGMTVLIFGNGRIGSNLARYLTAMNARILFYEPDTAKHSREYEFIARDRIDDTLKTVDAACLCFHWSEQNENFFDRARLDSMQDDAFLLNTSRGENIDEAYLCDLIERGKFAGIGLDVLRDEQSKAFARSRILELEKVTERLIVTPHIAGSSVDSERLAFRSIYDLVRRPAAGAAPPVSSTETMAVQS